MVTNIFVALSISKLTAKFSVCEHTCCFLDSFPGWLADRHIQHVVNYIPQYLLSIMCESSEMCNAMDIHCKGLKLQTFFHLSAFSLFSGGLNGNCPQMLICLNSWSQLSGTILEWLGDVILLEEVCYWGGDWPFKDWYHSRCFLCLLLIALSATLISYSSRPLDAMPLLCCYRLPFSGTISLIKFF